MSMIKYSILTTTVLLASSAVAQSIVDRAETAELRRNSGTTVPRVERDQEGHVTSLILRDMKLSPEEVAELPGLKHLRRLVLFRTNFSDRDLEHLERCRSLEHLNLTSTEVTDVAVDSILKLEKLRTLCLGNVNITPPAIDKLKAGFRTLDREINWRYTQRRRDETENSAANADVEQGSESTESKTDKQTAYPPSRVEDGPPPWLKEYTFKSAKFTFVRLRYTEPAGRWSTDYPDADINLSARVKRLTRLEVSANGLVMDIADPKLAAYPLAYLSANGPWQLTDKDAIALRGYVNGGGFLIVDDSWGPDELENTVAQLKKVLPERQLSELALEHELFHCVYDLQEKPQVCGIHYALAGREKGITGNVKMRRPCRTKASPMTVAG